MSRRYRGRDARALSVPPPNEQSGARTARNRSASSRTEIGEPALGDRYEYECGGCDHEADATYRFDQATGRPRWFISSFSSRCPGKGDCLTLVCKWLAELGIDTTSGELLDDPRAPLTAAGSKGARQGDDVPPLPSFGAIAGWHSRLLEQRNSAARDYLLGRGVSLEIVKRYRIGWDGRLLTFPMFDAAGELVAVKRRGPWSRATMKNPPGKDRPWPLYPRVPDNAGWLLLAAGEIDALCGSSVGLPTVSVTLGAGYWRDAWTEELRGLRVVVCFDNNEGDLAERRVRDLRAAGLSASRLDLRTLGVTTPKGDLSDYLNSGGDPKRIKPPGRRGT